MDARDGAASGPCSWLAPILASEMTARTDVAPVRPAAGGLFFSAPATRVGAWGGWEWAAGAHACLAALESGAAQCSLSLQKPPLKTLKSPAGAQP